MNTEATALYPTDFDHSGHLLVGGLWSFFATYGMPLEMQAMLVIGRGHRPDWFECILDADAKSELPALFHHLEEFLPDQVLLHLKDRYLTFLQSGRSWSEELTKKRQFSASLSLRDS